MLKICDCYSRGNLYFYCCLYSLFSNPGIQTVISAINRVLDSEKTEDTDEFEAALEALGQIGSCKFATQPGESLLSYEACLWPPTRLYIYIYILSLKLFIFFLN